MQERRVKVEESSGPAHNLRVLKLDIFMNLTKNTQFDVHIFQLLENHWLTSIIHELQKSYRSQDTSSGNIRDQKRIFLPSFLVQFRIAVLWECYVSKYLGTLFGYCWNSLYVICRPAANPISTGNFPNSQSFCVQIADRHTTQPFLFGAFIEDFCEYQPCFFALLNKSVADFSSCVRTCLWKWWRFGTTLGVGKSGRLTPT